MHMDVSENRGTPKSSILIGFSIINHPFWGTPIFGNTHIFLVHCWRKLPQSPITAGCQDGQVVSSAKKPCKSTAEKKKAEVKTCKKKIQKKTGVISQNEN